MKKLILASILTAVSAFAHADIIDHLDEVALLGKWNVTSINGSFATLKNGTPLSFEFNDTYYSYINFEGYSPSDIGDISGYWIGGGGFATGKFTLHLLNGYNFLGQRPASSLINFVISYFYNNEMVLESYDGTAKMTLVKDVSGVNYLPSDKQEETVVYDLNGVEVDSPSAPGVYVRSNGEKFIVK